MDWFLYDRDLRLERVKEPFMSYIRNGRNNVNAVWAARQIIVPVGFRFERYLAKILNIIVSTTTISCY